MPLEHFIGGYPDHWKCLKCGKIVPTEETYEAEGGSRGHYGRRGSFYDDAPPCWGEVEPVCGKCQGRGYSTTWDGAIRVPCSCKPTPRVCGLCEAEGKICFGHGGPQKEVNPTVWDRLISDD